MFRLGFALLAGAITLANTPTATAQVVRGSFQQPGVISPHEVTCATIDGNPMMVVYGRPLSKDPNSGEIRKIWGELVPYGEPWRTGSDDSTVFCTGLPIKMGDTVIPPGVYTLYTIPEEKEATKLVISKTIGQRGIPVDQDNDLAQIEMKKEALDKRVDQLTIAIEKTKTGGVLKIIWEKTQFSAPFTVEKKK